MRRRRSIQKALLLTWTMVSVLASLGCIVNNAQESNAAADAKALQIFNDRVQSYVKVHRQVEQKFNLPHMKPTHSVTKIQQRQHGMAQHIRELRASAHDGDIFTPEVEAYFNRALASAYQANSEGILASLSCVSDVVEQKLAANDVYPETWDYNAMPPTILLHIPQLPAELDYRIVNRDLIIRDVEADVIVDVLRDVITLPTGSTVCDD
jgi:hypothetical protein